MCSITKEEYYTLVNSCRRPTCNSRFETIIMMSLYFTDIRVNTNLFILLNTGNLEPQMIRINWNKQKSG